MVGHQAVAEELKRIAKLGVAEGLEEGTKIAIVLEYGLAVVPTAQGMLDKAIMIRSQETSHASNLPDG